MNLKTYIEELHLQKDLSLSGAYEIFSGSKTRYTRVLKGSLNALMDEVIALAERLDISPLVLIKEHNLGQPHRATLTHLIRISRLTGIHPCDLHEQHGLGRYMITQDDLLHLRTSFRVSPKPEEHNHSNHACQAETYEAARSGS